MQKHFNLIVILIFITLNSKSTNYVLSQTITPRQYYSFCIDNESSEGKVYKEHIKYVKKQNHFWILEFMFSNDCGLQFYPKMFFKNDTLNIKTLEIEQQRLVLNNTDTIVRWSTPEECYCTYDMKVELNVDTIQHIKINNKSLPISKEKFKTFPVRYIVHNNDTIGQFDKYGRKQGYFIIKERETEIVLSKYINNSLVLYELNYYRLKTDRFGFRLKA
ncbi:MAG: hypothetical protein ACPGSD_10815, partial [Flavobacteriales bacterium]